MAKDRVLLALSGGVDSSVAVLLLQEQGFEVVGGTMNTGYGNAAAEAALIADKCGISHHTVDVSEDFGRHIINGFLKAYERGLTPNPCIVCNLLIKFAFLSRLAEELGIDYLSTGHYARIGRCGSRYAVMKATVPDKDQSYMLYRLPQELLSRLILPLGEYAKNRIRSLASDFELPNFAAPDSQDICFIPDGDYRTFLTAKGAIAEEGDFVDSSGKLLGRHKGIINYTVGQRKGLGLALGYPAFVLSIDKEKNQVVLGREEELYTESCRLHSFCRQALEQDCGELSCSVKLRYRSQPVEAKLIYQGEEASLLFAEPQKAVTPGQSAVCYEGGLLLGGGIICC